MIFWSLQTLDNMSHEWYQTSQGCSNKKNPGVLLDQGCFLLTRNSTFHQRRWCYLFFTPPTPPPNLHGYVRWKCSFFIFSVKSTSLSLELIEAPELSQTSHGAGAIDYGRKECARSNLCKNLFLIKSETFCKAKTLNMSENIKDITQRRLLNCSL